MCHFSSYWGGGVPAILEIIYVFLWHESEAQGLSAHCSLQQESWKTFFPPIPPVLLHFHLPDGGCALTFAGKKLLDFPSLICLNEINGHSCGQIYPKLEFSHYWVSQQTELTQSKTPPTAITDSIILSEGTWSMKNYVITGMHQNGTSP